jgi:hypothetical protein
MTVRQLHHLLRGLEDTREIVVGRTPAGGVLQEVWRAAQAEADDLYAGWREHRGGAAYTAYRAAADRADAALDALVAYGATG